MLNIQKEFKDYLSKVTSKLKQIELPDTVINSLSIDLLQESIDSTELLVPVIGSFSAGKSSLINSFLTNEYLPVGITPETALATELRYSVKERIEAVKKDNSFDIFPINEIGKLGSLAANYKFIRLYISSEKLKEIQPLILVDMPGFESPLDLHNQAIMEYINKGVHYIVLTSVEDGTITRSMIRQLEDIQQYKRDFSFFLSKSDLRSAEEVESVKSSFEEAIGDDLDLTKSVTAIDNAGGNSLHQILSKIDPEKLFKSLFVDSLKENYYSIKESINTCVSGLSRSKEENEQSITELQKGFQSLIEKRDNLLAEAKEKYSDQNVNGIVETVGKDLSSSIDELVVSAISGGQDSLKGSISEIVTHSLISNINTSMEDVGNEIVDTFRTNLTSINSTMSDFSLPDSFIDRIASSSKDMLGKGKSGLEDLVGKMKESGKVYKTVATVLAVTTGILTPVLELIIIFLPEIMGYFQKKKREEETRNKILTEVIPALKGKLRETLPSLFNQQVEAMIVSISGKFEEEITLKQNTINSTQKELKDKVINIEKTISEYEASAEQIQHLSNTVIFN